MRPDQSDYHCILFDSKDREHASVHDDPFEAYVAHFRNKYAREAHLRDNYARKKRPRLLLQNQTPRHRDSAPPTTSCRTNIGATVNSGHSNQVPMEESKSTHFLTSTVLNSVVSDGCGISGVVDVLSMELSTIFNILHLSFYRKATVAFAT